MSLSTSSHNLMVVQELLYSLISQVSHSADLTGRFLQEYGFKASSEKPMYFPEWFLLDLGAALQVFEWEKAGLLEYLDSSLPSSLDTIVELLKAIEDPNEYCRRQPNSALGFRVTMVYLTSCAWHAPRSMQAQIALGQASEDRLIEGLAQFLWSRRSRNKDLSGSILR
jgi:hypothetical protein